MPMKVRQLGSGKYSDCFKVSGADCAVCLKVSYYRESTMRAFARHAGHGDLRAAHAAIELDAVAVATAMAEVGRTLRGHRVTPHLVDVFREADVRNLPRRLRPLLARRLPTLTDMQLARSHVCIMELCSCTLTSLVARAPQELSDRVMRGLIFQVVYTLACLQAALPGFRHNDLTTNNVLVKCTPRHAGARYTLGHGRSTCTTCPWPRCSPTSTSRMCRGTRCCPTSACSAGGTRYPPARAPATTCTSF